MKTFKLTIEGISPYSQSRFHDPQKIGKETNDDMEKRTWKDRVHVGDDGAPFMPPMSLKKSLDSASSYLGKIPGERNATYTKRFKSGLLIIGPIGLRVGKRDATLDDFDGEWLFLDATGKAGGTRVKRCMPRILNWWADATLYVVDEILTKAVLTSAISNAGLLVGVGRFRPEKGGFYGRYRLATVVEA